MNSLAYLNKYLYKYRFRLILGTIFVTVSNFFAVVPAQIIRMAFDLVNENIGIMQLYRGFELQPSAYSIFSSIVLLFGALVLLMALLRGIFLFFMRQTIIVVSRLIEYDLKNEIYTHYQELSLAFYRRNNTGDLMNRITEDVSRVRMYLGPAIMYSINTVALFVMVIITMLSINVKLTFFTILPLPVLAIVIYIVNSRIHRKSEQIQEQLSTISTFVQETFAGIRIMKAYVREKQTRKDFGRESQEYMDRSVSLAKLQAVFFPVIVLLVGISILLTVYIGGIEVSRGRITTGNIAEFIVYIGQLTFPMMALGWVSSIVQRAAASQKRINQFLHTRPEILSPDVPGTAVEGNIEFRNVSFTYPDTGIKALENVSFSAKKGEFLAIIGHTGSGKSTIVNLLGRMYDVNSGSVLVDGKDIREYNLTSLRQSFAFVPQDVFLFSDSIKNNIGFGLDQFSDEEIENAARNAAIYDNIQHFPEKFETRTGERGITMSGGQKQRTSIARAIIKDPAVLIFDDSLSAVDTKTEEEILQNLGRIMRGRTSIIISHRVSTIKNADNILVMKQGRVAESGTHEQLLAQEGLYKQLFEKQLLEEESG
ncbi:ATP-binding cassette subfamily B protein [Anseongella ginsenosidimutans]|uniref:ATP-binding cassette subfamily B protein n=1 Tax=Anseongella ginsenosidimutans TaxID=496056 RepID=A0A4R3KRY6_9SPHI|nr:ABC transporter ATP-binding protein [Anseongella ginsenosidimutans]QEC53176.1 ABC transporter ATP-binding protein [Anseongella ginsenosidimutans]TCS87804.1 ATP-binding cassette subfamily B protein [Anseongella ginsenosidimutans]